MNNQEKIRTELKNFGLGIAGYQEQYQEDAAEKHVDGLLRDLTKLGVAIKVKAELPRTSYRYVGIPTEDDLLVAIRKTQMEIINAGYSAWKPLIGDKDG